MQQRVSQKVAQTFLQRSTNQVHQTVMRTRMTNISYFNIGVPMRCASFNLSKVQNQQRKQNGVMGHTQKRYFSLPDHIKLEMPNLSPTMEKGNIGTWSKAVGDTIAPGDVLCSIETDKATVDFEMQDEGYVAKLLYPEGSKDVPLGKVLAIIVEDPADIAAFADYVDDGSSSGPVPESHVPDVIAPTNVAAPATPAAAPSGAPAKAAGGRQFISPVARNIAVDGGLDLASVSGTGPNGRIIRADVEEAMAAAKAAPVHHAPTPVMDSAPGIGYTDIQNSNIRKVIADRLTYSKQNIPHYYVTTQVCVDNLMKMRAKLNAHSSTKLSVNDFVMKAAALAAVKVPATNSSWMGDYIRQYDNVNMSFAVQTDNGLMAPNVNNVNLKGLEAVSTEIKDVAGRARENKLKPDELSGGTFTVSNLGMFGVNNFSAIVNPPQACILAVGGAFKQVVVNEDAGEGESEFKVAMMMNVTLSSDHRVVDGALAAQWGQEFKKMIESPELMLL